MLIFNEGVPGAGKSYDALVEHMRGDEAEARKLLALPE